MTYNVLMETLNPTYSLLQCSDTVGWTTGRVSHSSL